MADNSPLKFAGLDRRGMVFGGVAVGSRVGRDAKERR